MGGREDLIRADQGGQTIDQLAVVGTLGPQEGREGLGCQVECDGHFGMDLHGIDQAVELGGVDRTIGLTGRIQTGFDIDRHDEHDL